MLNPKKIFQFLKFIICGFLFGILILEIFIRLFFPQNIQPNIFVSKFGTIVNQHKANIREKLSYNGIPYHLIIDEHNLRNFKKISYKKPQSTFRILSLGDSMFKGPGLEANEIFAFYLDQALNSPSSQIKYEVVNADLDGANLLDYILFLKNEGYKYSPDLILLPWSNYDFGPGDFDYIKFEDITAKKINSKKIQIELSGPHIDIPKPFLNSLMLGLNQIPFYFELSKISHYLNFVRLNLNLLSSQEKRKNQLDDLGALLKAKNVLKNNETAKSFQIKWILGSKQVYSSHVRSEVVTAALFPKIVEILSKTVDEIGAKLAVLDMPDDEEIFGEPSATTSRKFPKSEKYFQFDLLDPIRSFLAKNQFTMTLPMDPHWSPAGHHLAALLTYNFLLENKLIPKNDLSNKTKFDLKNPKIISQIKNSNKRVSPYIDIPKSKYYQNGLIAKNNNRIEEAIKNLEQFLELEENIGISYKLGELYLEKGNTKKALIHFNNVEHSKKQFFLQALGERYFKLKMYKKALKVLFKAKNVGNPNAQVINAIGLCYRNLGNFVESEKYLIKAAKQNSFYAINLGNLYFDNGYFEKAIEQYKKILIQYPNHFHIYYLAGLAYSKLNNLQEAKKMFLQAQRIQPENKDVQSILNQIRSLEKSKI